LQVYDSNAFADVIEKRIKRATHIFYNDIATDIAVPDYLKYDKVNVQSPQPIIELQRVIKTPVEIQLMRTGANLSALSFIEV
jgi:Xaa-Pro aminopeptidase